MSRLSPLVAAAAAVVALAGAGTALAQFKSNDAAVEYRQSAFVVMGEHFERIGAMVQGKAPHDATAAARHAEVVAFMSTLPYAGFVDGTAGSARGGAGPQIWSERAKFDAAAKKMQTEAANLAQVAKGNDPAQLRTAFLATAGACKACHDDFRIR